nr:MAG TPA: hypothetical protein [Caudoviricetes sp.]
MTILITQRMAYSYGIRGLHMPLCFAYSLF